MTEDGSSNAQIDQLSGQVDELNRKIDVLNSKLEKSETTSAALLAQQQSILDATNTARSQEVLRQTVSNPTGFIGKEVVNYIIKALEKHEKSKTQQWIVTRGRKVAESAVTAYISQKLPQLNWYGTTCTGIENRDGYHMTTRTNFPVEINTGVPFIGKVAIAKVVLEVESDVDAKTNQTSNLKCHLSSESANSDLWASLKEDFTNWLRPHKTLWAILHPVGVGISNLVKFMKRETNFSIPFLILFILTLLVYPRIVPAAQIWQLLGFQTINFGLFGIRPINILFGIINGIVWGGIFWLIVRFNVVPGIGKIINFIRTRVWPRVRNWFMSPYRRWGTVGAVVVIIVFVVLWRVGVFEPPPPLQIAGTGIPNGRAGDAYSYDFVSSGGKAPYTWNVDATTLPEGLTFDPLTGILTGTPATAGTYPLTVKVNDSSTQINSISQNVTLKYSPAGSLIIINTDLPKGKLGEKYTTQIVTLGGNGPYRWGVSGYVPPGLILNAATGVISGVPTSRGQFSFSVSVDDNSPTRLSYDQAYILTIE
jgi:outer membrane murein-binding lipoprotein Lpp